MPNWKKVIVSGSDASLNSLFVLTSVTGSSFRGSFTGSLFGTASWAQNSLTASYFLTSSVTNATSASYAATASSADSFLVRSNLTASNALVNGTITAQTLVVTTISSSVIYSSGSNTFGDDTSDRQMFTGSVSMTGSLTVTGRATINNLTASLFGTASQATSASYSLTASSAVFATSALTASYVNPLVQDVLITGSLITSVQILAPSLRISSSADLTLGNINEGTILVGGDAATSKITSNVNHLALQTARDQDNIYFNLGAATTNRMFISSSGNVGIGTTTPSHTFEVNGISAVVTPFGAFTALQSAGSNGYRWTLANDNSFRLQYSTNGGSTWVATPMYISSSGNVGIGTITPTLATLQVNGNVYANSFTGSLFGTSSWAQNSLTASYFVTSSVTSASYAATSSYANNFTVANFLYIDSASLDYQQNLNVTTGSYQTIASVATGSYKCAFFDYVTFSASVSRAGTVYTIWSGSTTEYTETYTNDIGGSTAVVDLRTVISGGNIVLQAGISGSAWTVRSLVRLL